MTAEQLTSSSPIEPTESGLVQTKDAHSADENDDSGVDEQDPATSSDETESNDKNEEEIVETSSEQTIEAVAVEPTIGAAASAVPVTPATEVVDDDDIRYKNLKVMYGGRDILDFCANISNKSWHVQYTYLPEKNISMCLANRSQYHRLSATWDAKESKMDTCRKCSFQYPVKTPDFQCQPVKKTTALDAINSKGLTDNNMNRNRASPMFNGNQQKSMNMFNTNNNMNNPNVGLYEYMSMFQKQNSAATAMNNNNNASKQANYGFQYNGNGNGNNNPNGFMNNFNQGINNTNANNNMLNNKQLYAMHRQNLNNSNNANNNNNNNMNANANNYVKMPYKMYSHFY